MKHKMRILYFGPIPKELGGKVAGGIATHAWQLAFKSAEMGNKVSILSNIKQSFNLDGVEVICLPQNNVILRAFYGFLYYLSSPYGYLKKIEFLSFKEKIALYYKLYSYKTILKRINPDILHVHSLLNIDSIVINVLQKDLPFVITDHGVGVVFNYKIFEGFKIDDYKKAKDFVIYSLEAADCVISVSKFSKDQLIKNFEIHDGNKIKSILNPIEQRKLPLLDRDSLKKEMDLEGKKVILFSGVHSPIEKKGLGILLKAFCIDDYLIRNCILIIVTSEEATKFAKDFLAEKKVKGLILGPQPWEALIKYYNASDIFVLPSRTEGIGLVYEEALLAGIPIIGFSESVEELQSLLGTYIGEKFDAINEDEVALANKIVKVLSYNIERIKLREKVITNLSWDSQFIRFQSIYEDLYENSQSILLSDDKY